VFIRLVLSLLTLHDRPGWFSGRIETGREFFGRSASASLRGARPARAVLLALTVVGIPLALIGLAAWAIGLYLGSVVVAALIGRSLVRPHGDGMREFGMSLAVGLLLVFLLRNLPFVGGAAGWVIALVGVGLFVQQVHQLWQRSRVGAAPLS
jgi:hypothetical protein